jgi:triosephosphate isomerase
MLKDVGTEMVVVGHSERRADHHESDALIAAKAAAVMAAGMVPVVCVGELEGERVEGRHEAVVVTQLHGSLAGLTLAHARALVVAYEPVWAIGTGRTATAEDAQAMCKLVRQVLVERFGAAGDSVRVLYGGSMKADNAAELTAQPDIDGGLVGGASLERSSFLAIARAAHANR